MPVARNVLLSLFLCGLAGAEEPVKLVTDVAVAPDGGRIAFAWRGDLWSADSGGGEVTRLTNHLADDEQPAFSPDGEAIAFVSDRDGANEVFVMPAAGGAARQVTFHTGGYGLEEYFPGGNELLVGASRDHHWRMPQRLYAVDALQRKAERLLFDAAARNGTVSPDGKRILFVRDGVAWWRKGYRGSQAASVWMHDTESGEFAEVLTRPGGCRSPLWLPGGEGCWYVGQQDGAFNLYRHLFDGGDDEQLTFFKDDSVVDPAVSRDGSTIVFRHLFDLYRYRPGADKQPTRIDLAFSGDATIEKLQRRKFDSATEVAFSKDGLEIAFVAGGDVWVMDTELREPKQVTDTPGAESSVEFSPDLKTLAFVSHAGGRPDVWKAERKDAEKYWWQNDGFTLTQLTDDELTQDNVDFSPAGDRLAFLEERGSLVLMDLDGQNRTTLVESWNELGYQWSPDGQWMLYSQSDDDFNGEVFVTKTDGTGEPFNLSRHPDNDGGAVWSPDGKWIAFAGRRIGDETDVYYVPLRSEEAEQTRRDRQLKKALEKMKKSRKDDKKSGGKKSSEKPGEDEPKADPGKKPPLNSPGRPPQAEPKAEPTDTPEAEEKAEKPEETEGEEKKETKSELPEVVIDFEGIHDRIKRIGVPDSRESGLMFSPDSKKLAFRASVKGQSGFYEVELPEVGTPKLLSGTSISSPTWIKEGNQILGHVGGVPASLVPPSKTTKYPFDVYQQVDLEQRYRAAFLAAWRVMRDRFYDGAFNNRDWDAIRDKYLDAAGMARTNAELGTVVSLMLGELNASHLGFYPAGESSGVKRPEWTLRTPHFGLQFDMDFAGPGLLVKDVLPESPAAKERSRIRVGEIVLEIDGQPVDRTTDLTAIANSRLDRDYRLKVKEVEGENAVEGESGREGEGEKNQERKDAVAEEPDAEESVKGEAGEMSDETKGSDDTEEPDETGKPGDAEKSEEKADGTRVVVIRALPFSFGSLRNLLYEEMIEDNRAKVDELSGGKLGYVHIQGMNFTSFYRFEEELYSAGYGKEGLVIDVRNNGGGSTTDHLLTVLTQPVHAVTVPRGGGPGYPQDRKVYASWNKPIVVLCNQNSFSNAEIFSHAVKALDRGKLVGVPTAGGVISTGGARVMDLGFIRTPFRGWYLKDTGEDMELNGAVPDFIVPAPPGAIPAGNDPQLKKAVEVLEEEVAEEKRQPPAQLRRASERLGKPAAGAASP